MLINMKKKALHFLPWTDRYWGRGTCSDVFRLGEAREISYRGPWFFKLNDDRGFKALAALIGTIRLHSQRQRTRVHQKGWARQVVALATPATPAATAGASESAQDDDDDDAAAGATGAAGQPGTRADHTQGSPRRARRRTGKNFFFLLSIRFKTEIRWLWFWQAFLDVYNF